jgi:uncharacterized protein (TIGR00255 family)
MKSMTGYGRATAPLGLSTLTVQISSVNRKTLDLGLKLPGDWDSLELEISEHIRRAVSRGRVSVVAELTGDKNDEAGLRWDEARAAADIKRLSLFARTQGLQFTLSSELLLSLVNSQRGSGDMPDAEEAKPVFMKALDEALRSFVAMRAKEGETLLVDFLKRIELLRKHVDAIATRAPQVPSNYRDLLLKRLRDTGLELDLNDERVLKEISIFADRCDISEEITRFRSHLDQFVTLLKSDAEIGRKAEFILQEMGREVNTMGSKANDITISRAVIELKNELERIREQIANVE